MTKQTAKHPVREFFSTSESLCPFFTETNPLDFWSIALPSDYHVLTNEVVKPRQKVYGEASVHPQGDGEIDLVVRLRNTLSGIAVISFEIDGEPEEEVETEPFVGLHIISQDGMPYLTTLGPSDQESVPPLFHETNTLFASFVLQTANDFRLAQM